MGPREYTGVEEAVIRARLGALVPQGLVAYNVGNEARELLELHVVRNRISDLLPPVEDDEVDEDDVRDEVSTEALTAVLKLAVEEINTGNYRRLLKRVLPLKKDLLGTPLRERRSAAANAFKDKKSGKPVEVETIRTYHEPRALDALARVLIQLEAQERGERAP